MKSPGIEVKPIITIDGDHEVNSVFFTDVKVPAENLIGEEGKGWTYAKFLLAHERFGIAGVGASKRQLERLKEISKDLGDDDLIAKVSQLEIDIMALEFTELRLLSALEGGGNPGAESSILKIKGTEIQQRLTELYVEAAGEFAIPYGGPDGYGFDPEKWKLFADQGWLAMPFSSESGGFDFGPIELSILFEEFGKFLVLEPYLSNVVLSGYILDNSSFDKKNDFISKLISGEEQISLAYMEQNRNYEFKDITCLLEGTDSLTLNGTKNLVLNGSNADHYLVTVNHNDVTTIVLVSKDTDGLSINNFKTVDDRRISQLNFENVGINADQIVATGDEAEQLIKDAINYGTLCVSAEAVGCMESCYLKTVEYTKSREQFGQPISNFQVLQHKMVDMFIEAELCKSLLYKSMIDMHENNDSKYRSVSALKSQVGLSGKKVGEDAVQLHGGMGVSEEMSIGHYLKRFISIDSQFGNSHFHLKKFNNS